MTNSVFRKIQTCLFPKRYGEQCQNENKWRAGEATQVDESSFSRLELGDKAELLWRVEGGEVEMVMTAETRSSRRPSLDPSMEML